MEDQRTARVPVSTPATSAPVNPTDEGNLVNDRGKFPAARRKRKSKAGDVVNQGAHSLPTQHDTQPPTPAGSSQPETNNNDRPTQMSGRMEIDKILDSNKPQPAQLPAPPQAAAPPAQPGSERAKEEPPKAATIWPEPKRLALAQAASKYVDDVITNINRGRKCPPEMVLSLIDQNPSYIELCGMLESRGYVLNRVHFAKHLLKAVPELTTSSNSTTHPNPPANGPSSTPNQEQRQPPPTTTPLPPPTQYGSPYAKAVPTNNSAPIPPVSTAPPGPGAQAVGNQMEKPATPSTSMPPPTNGTSGYLGSYQLPVSVPPENQVPGFLGSPPPPPPPPTFSKGKQAPGSTGPHSHPRMPPAFRHSIGGPVPSPIGGKLKPKLRVPAPPAQMPAPGSKAALARKRTFAEIVDFTQLSSDDDDSPPPPKAPRLEDVPPHSGTNMDVDIQEVPASASETPEAPEAPAKTLDLSQFRMPDADSSTSNEALRRRTDIIKPLNKTEALKTRYYDPKTIARDILIATGRHPTERPLNQHLSKLRDNFPAVENSSDLRTFRWDIVDPGGPLPPEVPLVSAVSRPPLITVRQYAKPPSGRLPNQSPRDPTKDAGGPQFPHTPSQLRISQTVNNSDDLSPHVQQENNNKNNNINNSVMSSTPSTSGPRRRGRPLGAKNKPTFADRVEVAIPTSSSPKAAQRPYRTYKCEWKGCDAQLHNLQTLRKHVTRLHIPKDNVIGLSCLWAGCSGTGNTFTNNKLADHLEKIHLSALAWTLGEGPGSVRSGETGKLFSDPIVVS